MQSAAGASCRGGGEHLAIQRIDRYDDPRFRRTALLQHGGFLVGGQPWEIEITGENLAVIHGEPGKLPREALEELMNAFRFFAEHISRFTDEAGRALGEFPAPRLFPVELGAIQPSQFCVDEDKRSAVRTFIKTWRDIKIPLVRYGERFISCDGHTRLSLAAELGFSQVLGFLTEENPLVFSFAEAAAARGVTSPREMQALPHSEYEIKWNRFCDAFLKNQSEKPV